MSLPHKCDVCGAETDGVFKLMSTAGQDRVMVRFFCDKSCHEPFITKQNEDGGCSWCGVAVGLSSVHGPMNEQYCDTTCYESAGKALFRFNLRENPGDGEILGL